MKNIQNLYIKTNDMCVGDHMHNDYMDILVKDIPHTKYNQIIIDYFAQPNWKTGHWVFDIFNKEELRKLNVIMRTKNKVTLNKRIQNLLNSMLSGHPISVLLDKNKIESLSNTLEIFAKKWMEVHNG